MATTQSADIQNTFREAVNHSSSPHPSQTSTYYWGAFDKITQSTFGWATLAWLIIFLFLYLVNPPFVQKTDSDMAKPTPNVTTICVISTICATGVIAVTKFNILPGVQ